MDHIINQSHQNLNNMVSLETVDIYKIPIVKATEKSLEGYGNLVDNFDKEKVKIVQWPQTGSRPIVDGTGTGGGIVEERFIVERKGNILYGMNKAVKRKYITGWYIDPAEASDNDIPVSTRRIYTHEANYHPDGGQVFYPVNNKPFIALLARPGDNIRPMDFVGFYFDGSFGIQINPNVWHQPMFPVEDRIEFLNKQGAVHACVGVDFIKEFKTYIEIPIN